MPNGYIVWEGPSPVDGSPLVCILTSSDNRKTGPSYQTWILRADMHPLDAINSGSDKAICGTCPHRKNQTTGKRTCYVNLMPTFKIYNKYKRGGYTTQIPQHVRQSFIRLGAYGDPALVPFEVNKALLAQASGWTGYTHQWRESWFDERYCQILHLSADSPEDGWETPTDAREFIVVPLGEAMPKGVIECPGSEQYFERTNKKVQCVDCGLCRGNSSASTKSIGVYAHGTAKRLVKYMEVV